MTKIFSQTKIMNLYMDMSEVSDHSAGCQVLLV